MAPLPETPRRSASSRTRTRPKSAGGALSEKNTSGNITSEPPPKKRRYIPGGPGGGGRYVDEDGNEIPVGGTGPGGYSRSKEIVDSALMRLKSYRLYWPKRENRTSKFSKWSCSASIQPRKKARSKFKNDPTNSSATITATSHDIQFRCTCCCCCCAERFVQASRGARMGRVPS